MSYSTATKTAQRVVDYVKRQFGDESGVQVTDADIFRWINAGQEEIFRRNEPVKATSTADLIAGQHTYTFPAGILKVQSLLVNGVPIPVRSYQEAEEYLLSQDPARTETGDAQIWYEWGGDFTIWPTPDKNLVGGITIKYVKAPAEVDAVTDVLSIPDIYFNRLVEFVLAQAYELDENWAAAEAKTNQFGQNLDMQMNDANTQHNTYPRITVLDEDL